MDLTKKQTIWLIVLFGTLIGFNETVIGSFNIPYKSVILSAITLSLFSYARYYIARIGTSLLIMTLALVFKLTDLGVQFCKPVMLILLGIGFEVFASLFISKKQFKLQGYIFTCVLSSVVVFAGFALFETNIAHNAYWVSQKFNDYVFVKAPFTAIASTLLSVLGIFVIKRIDTTFVNSFFKKPALTQLVMGLFIAVLWIVGYGSMHT
jgi:hypothetical protein